GTLTAVSGSPFPAGNYPSWVATYSPTAAANNPPVAVAGTNQAGRPGTAGKLNGSGSYDDNTPTNLLQSAWMIVSAPSGSAVTLTGANTMTPSFLPDLV